MCVWVSLSKLFNTGFECKTKHTNTLQVPKTITSAV